MLNPFNAAPNKSFEPTARQRASHQSCVARRELCVFGRAAAQFQRYVLLSWNRGD
jgi:hypothetical protein